VLVRVLHRQHDGKVLHGILGVFTVYVAGWHYASTNQFERGLQLLQRLRAQISLHVTARQHDIAARDRHVARCSADETSDVTPRVKIERYSILDRVIDQGQQCRDIERRGTRETDQRDELIDLGAVDIGGGGDGCRGVGGGRGLTPVIREADQLVDGLHVAVHIGANAIQVYGRERI
jgi:hypothetical protein